MLCLFRLIFGDPRSPTWSYMPSMKLVKKLKINMFPIWSVGDNQCVQLGFRDDSKEIESGATSATLLLVNPTTRPKNISTFNPHTKFR